MDFTEITQAVEKLDSIEWANLNLFFPRKLQIAIEGKDILNAMNYAITPTNNALGQIKDNFSTIEVGTGNDKIIYKHGDCKPLLKEIRGINFSNIPLSKENNLLTAEKRSNNSRSTIDLAFLLDKELSPMTLYKNWRRLITSESLTKTTNGTTKDEEGKDIDVNPGFYLKKALKSQEGSPIAEGTLICTYVQVNRASTGIDLKTLGELFITGLIPISITTPTSLGPGVNAKGDADEVVIKCIYSLGYLQLGGSNTDSANSNEATVDRERLWLV